MIALATFIIALAVFRAPRIGGALACLWLIYLFS
jgi:hypothetical protein